MFSALCQKDVIVNGIKSFSVFSVQCSFKNVFQTEKYLKVLTHKWYRSNLVRFRVRTLGLNATKRWYHTDTSAGSPCPMCGWQTEDEVHFLFVCKSYDDIRQKCMLVSEEILKRMDITSILLSEDEALLRSLAKFISLAWDRRRKKMTL